jgi:alanyl-tRNA synthetase
MEKQRDESRAHWKGSGAQGVAKAYLALANEGHRSEFRGYDTLDLKSEILAILREGVSVGELVTGEEGEILTRVTPFYPEGGGQVGDIGTIRGSDSEFNVTDTQKPTEGIILHKGRVTSGPIRVGDSVTLSVNPVTRAGTRRNHTSTHLLHAALRKVLGEHVAQKGSLVGPNRLRFDFSHFKAIDPSDLRRIEDLVYEQILRNTDVVLKESTPDEARREGAMAFFGEKYGERVRVISVPGFSMELCGGTHVSRTGDIGLFRIVSEASVSSGVRRIEALTGVGALDAVRSAEAVAEAGAGELRTTPDQLPAAVRKLVEENRALRRQIEDAERKRALSAAGDLLSRVRTVGDVKVLAAESTNPDTMRDQADKLRDQLGSGVVVLAAKVGDKARLLVAVTPDLAGKRLDAGKLVGALAPHVGGRGGGRPDFAQAGGDKPDGLPTLIEEAYAQVGRVIGVA